MAARPENFLVLDTDDANLLNLGDGGLTAPVQSAMLESMLFIGGGTSMRVAEDRAISANHSVRVWDDIYDDMLRGLLELQLQS